MEVNILNPVQKATYFLKKSKVGKINNVQYRLLRQLQTSDYRFRALSALISAASPEKW